MKLRLVDLRLPLLSCKVYGNVKELEIEREDTVAFTRCLTEVAIFKFFVFSQPLVSPDKGLTELDRRLHGAATPNGQRANARVSRLSISNSLVTSYTVKGVEQTSGSLTMNSTAVRTLKSCNSVILSAVVEQ